MAEFLPVIFIGVFAVYLTTTVASHIRGRKEPEPKPPTLFRAFMQSPLVLLAFALAWQSGALGRSLFSIPMLALGLVLGHVVFVCSVMATHRVYADAREVLADLSGPREYFVNNPHVVLRIVHLSLTEELIYRVVLQGLLTVYLGAPAAIGVTAMLFGLSHEHLFRNRFGESMEFLVFSVLLGALYYATASLALVVMVHAVRNFAIAHIEFHGRADDLGSDNAAQQELDETMRQTAMETR